MHELGPNEDLREARQRYFEQHTFPLFSHIDFRVSDAQAVRPFSWRCSAPSPRPYVLRATDILGDTDQA